MDNENDNNLYDDLDGIFDDDKTDDEDITPNIGDKLVNIEGMIGVESFKREMNFIAKYAETFNDVRNRRASDRLFPIHYIFTIKPSMGITTILKNFTLNLYRLGLIPKNNFVECEGILNFDFKKEQNSPPGVFLTGHGGAIKVDNDYGVIAIDMVKQMDDPSFKFNKLMDLAYRERGKVVFVFLINDGTRNHEKLIENIKGRINCRQIDFSDFSNDELIALGRESLRKFGFELDKDAETYFIEKINMEKRRGSFENIRSIIRIMDSVLVDKISSINQRNFTEKRITAKDFDIETSMPVFSETDSTKELDEIIGLENIKNKLKEIVANAKVQRMLKDMGIKNRDMCYHMVFTGNPGTGKTTMARILGRMFKEAGILRLGYTYEVGRDGLVGRYVGYTAPKVMERVREALGSVLFIDEAYSLYSGNDRVDYGHEVIETLVRVMEDRRHELIVIMAGYTEEMEKLLDMNPGLRDRIPYRIEFPDYSSEELMQIFLKQLGSQYKLESGVYERLKRLFDDAKNNTGKNFGNGRFARNIAERLEIKHSMRICEENITDTNQILSITLKDVEALLNDDEVMKSIKNPQYKTKKIGF